MIQITTIVNPNLVNIGLTRWKDRNNCDEFTVCPAADGGVEYLDVNAPIKDMISLGVNINIGSTLPHNFSFIRISGIVAMLEISRQGWHAGGAHGSAYAATFIPEFEDDHVLGVEYLQKEDDVYTLTFYFRKSSDVSLFGQEGTGAVSRTAWEDYRQGADAVLELEYNLSTRTRKVKRSPETATLQIQ
ncbi:hypothetical protein H072_10472 [Dactylellina haptotyla CBS 200.50]|uniref:Uncharacterized protein n=1 Tax=Dactylellina haptotyla (strain CBS 200.50) TaxID=1284197 RepID=S8BA87_DACHA|nr:hypothetical protein H072_10472 [Dactylellina haptotyla CBS 200.50]